MTHFNLLAFPNGSVYGTLMFHVEGRGNRIQMTLESPATYPKGNVPIFNMHPFHTWRPRSLAEAYGIACVPSSGHEPQCLHHAHTSHQPVHELRFKNRKLRLFHSLSDLNHFSPMCPCKKLALEINWTPLLAYLYFLLQHLSFRHLSEGQIKERGG